MELTNISQENSIFSLSQIIETWLRNEFLFRLFCIRMNQLLLCDLTANKCRSFHLISLNKCEFCDKSQEVLGRVSDNQNSLINTLPMLPVLAELVWHFITDNGAHSASWVSYKNRQFHNRISTIILCKYSEGIKY